MADGIVYLLMLGFALMMGITVDLTRLFYKLRRMGQGFSPFA